MEFVTELYHGRGPQTQIMFGIGGETDLSERTLDHLSGYGGSTPVRVGNAAYKQRQNDVFGALLDSIYIHSKTRGGVPEEMAPIVFEQAEAASSAWHLPDQGIWESRGEPKHYVSSKLMSWVALDRASRLARSYGRSELEEKWAREAETVQADILDRGVSDRGMFRQHYETDALDAVAPPHPADPLPALRGRAAPGDGPRDRGRAHRARAGPPLQGRRDRRRAQRQEGTFTICSFWLVSALSEIGERKRARKLCERLVSNGTALGLYAEEIEPISGAQLGNFPQAFSHLALINAVTHVIADDQHGDRDEPSRVFTEMRAVGAAG